MKRIGSRKPRKVYLKEWRLKRHLTQEQLAQRLETNSENITRWETGSRNMNSAVLADLAYALDIEVPDLFRDPERPTADDLLRELPPGLADNVLAIIDRMRRTGT
jgi:transcriptional regulator with XRE-family HTH domain